MVSSNKAGDAWVEELVRFLRTQPGVSAVRSSVCLNEIKFTTALPLE